MTPAGALLIVALLVSVGIVGYAWWRWGPKGAAAAVAAVSAAWATAWGLWETFRPIPARPTPPRRPDAPLPEAEAEGRAVEEHRAHVEEMERVKAIEDGPTRRKELARLANGKWSKGPDSTGGET